MNKKRKKTNAENLYEAKALKSGSPKQKFWAYEIREQFLTSAASDESKLFLLQFYDTNKASYWIANKDKDFDAFVSDDWSQWDDDFERSKKEIFDRIANKKYT